MVLTKTICVIECNKKTLPILDYMDTRSFITLSLSGSVILWVYEGMAMLIPAGRIKNLANLMEDVDKWAGWKSYKQPKYGFVFADTIILPKKIAAALLGDE